MSTGDAPLSRRRLRGRSPSDGGALRHLPHFATSFIGRESQLEEVIRLLAETRLLTLVGPGGIGKTRLAVAAAGAATSLQVDGVAFADLSALLDARLVVQAVAAALGLEEQPGRSLREAVLEWLRTKYVLLVLDNCEHVIQDCAELVDQLLQRCSQLRILATSREPMGLAGETVWRVPSLGLPDLQQIPTLEAMLNVGAVRLFVERARAVQTNFELTQLNARAVADICVQLDGIPLAIELAAAQTHLLSAQELRMRLSHPLQVLTRGTRLAPGRQRTIRATLDWSYELLRDAEKLLLGRLSVFSGSWALSGAEAICAGEGIANEEVLDLLGRLLDKSLVRVEQDGDEQRYRLLEPVRQYAAERLDKTGETDRIRDHHQKWCLALLEEAEPEWFGPRQTVWLARLDREHDNLRAAMAWSLTEDADIEAGLRLGALLWRFWDMRSYLSEGTDYLRRLLLRPGTDAYPRARAQALMVLGYLETIRGDHTEARTVITEAERYWRSINDNRALAVTLFYAGLLSAWSQTDIEPAETLLTASLSLARSHGPVWTTYFTLMRMGDLARLRGDGERAQELLEESRQLTEAANDGWGQARCLHSLGQVRLMRGDAYEARRLLVDSLSLAISFGDRRGISYAVDGLGCVAAAQGRATLAARLFGRAEAARESMGDLVSAVFDRDRRQGIDAARSALGSVDFDAEWSAGHGLSLDQVLAEAFELVASEPAAAPAGLSTRELEVLQLIAVGKSNREIADTLCISMNTVARHVSNIFDKVGAANRTEAAAYAHHHCLAE